MSENLLYRKFPGIKGPVACYKMTATPAQMREYEETELFEYEGSALEIPLNEYCVESGELEELPPTLQMKITIAHTYGAELLHIYERRNIR